MAAEDPDHPIIESGRDWEVTSLRLELGPPEPYLDMTLRREQASRRLRFWSPRQLRLGVDDAAGGLRVGLAVTDVSARGMEGVRVEVRDFDFDALHFWARDVIDLDQGG